ncbi:Flavinator of succinate dehydrogenase [Fragilaria crotonensis]|nr:Flavinator of succinate dehydrogenase [Fragilaria crotonensis]
MSMRSVLSATALSRRALRLSTTTTKASGIRFYRGESGDAETRNLSAKEQELLTVAMPRSDAIMERHVRFPKLSEIPRASLGPPQDELVSDEELELQVRKKRLVYRSKQRGWLEVDLLLGTWANENVPSLSPEELDEFEAFVNMDTIDIYNIVTLRLDIPEALCTPDGSGVVERIQAWAKAHPLGKADPEAYEKVKTENNLI